MAMPLSGADGEVNFAGTKAHVTDITVRHEADITPFASSSTSGVKGRIVGHLDVSGSFSALYDPGLTPGQCGNMMISIDGSSGAAVIDESAVILSVETTIPIGGATGVVWNVEWASQEGGSCSS